ncbi:hypothetical protein [Salinisphaera orenii]|uniref:hypothetical protein n=1 Tax=Salinisphaera orenii TaxID=856731 RepID=UPI000DBE5C74
MKQCCPECGHVAPLTAFAAEADAREALAIAMRLPGQLGDSVLRYLALFRPAKRALAWSRALKLLGQLATDIDRGYISRHGRDWAAPVDAWRDALHTVVSQREALTLPLKDHSYLYEIICRGANRVEAKAEQAVEDKRRARKRGAPEPAAPASPEAPTTGGPNARRRPPVTDAMRDQIDAAIAATKSSAQPTDNEV